MTDQNDARVEVIQADRVAAWPHRPAWYHAGAEEDWLNGIYDSADVIQHFARHRIASAATARAEVVEECARAIRRAGERVASIETPRMEGENFAVMLCSHFDDGEGEQDEWGWTDAATNGYEEVISAIQEHFNSAIRSLAPARDEGGA